MYLAHFPPVFARFHCLDDTVPTSPKRNPGPRNGGTSTKSRELGPSFDTTDANQRIAWQSGVGALVSLLLFAERYRYGALFSMEGDGLLLVGTLMPFANVVQIGIAVGCGAMRSILTGLALVTWPALIQIFAFWPVALLLGYTLAFSFGFGVIGLWVGEAIGCEMQPPPAVLAHLPVLSDLARLPAYPHLDDLSLHPSAPSRPAEQLRCEPQMW